MVPEHGFGIATGYDDCYNQTPERVLRQALALGYRGAINHYVGMSHYARLEPDGEDFAVSAAGGALNAPCVRWHEDFAARCSELGFALILSLSYELFDDYCPDGWKQRAFDGAPALTGWVPPSTLLSPASAGAMGYLQDVARAFVGIAREAGLAVRFQIGEPWWWVTPDGRPCLMTMRQWRHWVARRRKFQRYMVRSMKGSLACSRRRGCCWRRRPPI